MVKREALVGTGQLPKFADNLYRDAEEDFWMIPTAEVPVTNMYRDEILDGDKLPIYHVAYTSCFRREKMSAGRDVRGIKRGHQFDKVEMVKFVRPETSMDELATLIDNAEDVCRGLGIPHRIIQMCTGDLSFTVGGEIRRRDLGAGLPGMAGGQLVQQLHGFPGAAGQPALPACAGRQTRISPHAQRLGAGAAARHDRGDGDLPAAGRLDHGA